MEAEELIDTLPDTPLKDRQTIGDTMGNVNANRRPAGWHPTTGEGRANFDTLRNARVEAQVDTLAEKVPNAKAKTPLKTLSDIKIKALNERLADTLAEAEAELLADTSRYVEAVAHVETLHNDLVEAED